jgi:DNA mismatch repair protein MutS2
MEWERVSRLRQSLSEAKDRYERLAQELEENKDRILHEEQERARTAVKNAERRFQKALRSLRESSPATSEEEHRKQRREYEATRKKLVQELRPAKKTLRRIPKNPFALGNRVRIKGSRDIGTVVSNEAGGRKIEVFVGEMRIHTTVDRLEYVGPARIERPASSHRVSASYSSKLEEVNLIGLTVQDALDRVEKVIDQAILSGQNHVDLVHGMGTGALRKAIQERLKEHVLVKSFDHPDVRHGGMGVTSVELVS